MRKNRFNICQQIPVGYGTQTPQSIAGKAIGGFCAIVGVFILTLPVPIVVNSFASYYKNRLWRNEVAHKRTVRAAQQAELVKEILVSNNRRSSNVGNSSIAGKKIKCKNFITYSILPNRRVYTFISGKLCLLASIKVKRQTLPEINVYTRLFERIEYTMI